MSYPPYGGGAGAGGYGAPGGYPPQGGAPGYPPAPGGAPAPGYPPAAGGFGAPQPGMPTPDAGYGMPAPGGLPYSAQPNQAGGLGFNMGGGGGGYGAPQGGGMPMPGGGGAPGYGAPQGGTPGGPGFGGAPPGGMPGQYPPAGGAPSGYPPAGGAPAGYPPAGGAPPGGYPPATGAPGGYPAAGGAPAGYPAAGGAPAGYPAAGGAPAGYPAAGGAPAGYPAAGGAPAGAPAGYPAAGGAPAGYPGAGGAPAQAYPGTPGGVGYNTPTSTAPTQGQGAPAGGTSYHQKCDPTLRPYPRFSADEDATKLRKAMKGFGTDEKAIIDVLAYRSCDQRVQIKQMFKTMYGKDLVNELKSELSYHFENSIVALLMRRDEYDAYELKRAMKGLGTDEDALIEILCSRSNREIAEINTMYKQMYRTTLEKDIISDTSGHFKRLLVSLSTGHRAENTNVDMNKAQTDAQKLYQAGEKQWGTDESQFNAILAAQSYEQLRAVFDAYSRISGKDLGRAISNEMSGNLYIGMSAIVSVVKNKAAYFAQQMYKSMKGAGTDDRTLVRIVVTRCEVDMVQIKQEFQKLYGKSLEGFISDDTSGDYKRILLALVGGHGAR